MFYALYLFSLLAVSPLYAAGIDLSLAVSEHPAYIPEKPNIRGMHHETAYEIDLEEHLSAFVLNGLIQTNLTHASIKTKPLPNSLNAGWFFSFKKGTETITLSEKIRTSSSTPVAFFSNKTVCATGDMISYHSLLPESLRISYLKALLSIAGLSTVEGFEDCLKRIAAKDWRAVNHTEHRLIDFFMPNDPKAYENAETLQKAIQQNLLNHVKRSYDAVLSKVGFSLEEWRLVSITMPIFSRLIPCDHCSSILSVFAAALETVVRTNYPRVAFNTIVMYLNHPKTSHIFIEYREFIGSSIDPLLPFEEKHLMAETGSTMLKASKIDMISSPSFRLSLREEHYYYAWALGKGYKKLADAIKLSSPFSHFLVSSVLAAPLGKHLSITGRAEERKLSPMTQTPTMNRKRGRSEVEEEPITKENYVRRLELEGEFTSPPGTDTSVKRARREEIDEKGRRIEFVTSPSPFKHATPGLVQVIRRCGSLLRGTHLILLHIDERYYIESL